MTIEKLQADMVTAWKSKDMVRKGVLSTLIDLTKKSAIDKGCRDNIPEEIVDAAIMKEQKTLQEMIGNCTEDYKKLKAELEVKYAIVCEYAPVLVSNPDEIKKMLTESGLELTKANRGNIMKYLKGKCDMKIANSVVGTMLA